MRFDPLDIEGAFLVAPEPAVDGRGSFARVFCKTEFEAMNLRSEFTQASTSFSTLEGTIRGMHYSVGEHAETKLVRCTAGAVHDVMVDIRPGSPSFGRTIAFTLSSANRLALYVPAGVAHGFQTLSPGAEVLYLIDKPYAPQAGRGFRWNDAAVATIWPRPVTVISERDRTYPDLRLAAEAV